MSAWTRLKARYGETIERFGSVAIGTYLALFVLTLVGFWLAIRMGFEPAGATASAGTVGAAWVATKLTQPVRIGVTVLLTPLIAALLERFRPKLPDEGEPN